MVGPVICDRCKAKPVDNDSKFYHCRFTTSGKDDGIGAEDKKLCASCLTSAVSTIALRGTIESIRRIENPKVEVNG